MSKLAEVSLRKWFYLHARIPLFLSVLTFLGVEALLLGLVGKNQLEHQQGVAQRLAGLSQLAIQQKSTALLQAAFEIAIRELGAQKAFVCERSLLYVLKDPKLSECIEEKKLGYRVLEVPLKAASGSPDERVKQYLFVLQVPILPRGSVVYATLGLSLLACALGLFLLYRMGKKFEEDLVRPLFKNLAGHQSLPIRELEAIRTNLLKLGKLKTQEAVNQALIHRNAQVAHDIKSPLTALLFASKDFELLPNDSRSIIGTAVKRISAIVDSLAEPTTPSESKAIGEEKKLYQVLKELHEEKKAEYSGYRGLVLKLNMADLDPKVNSPIEEQDLKRALSNLINNGIEALPNYQGVVELKATVQSEAIEIGVKDSGKGMSLNLLSQLGRPGFTWGKEAGSGLGFSYAKKVFEKAGGQMKIRSEVNQGSEIGVVFQ